MLLILFDVFGGDTKIIGFYTGYSCDFGHNWVNCVIEMISGLTKAAQISRHKRQKITGAATVPTSDLMLEGLTLMVFGMGFVFTFLTLLVLATKTMSATVLRFSPVEDLSVLTPPLNMASPSQQVANDAQLMAVLSAAVHRYSQDRS